MRRWVLSSLMLLVGTNGCALPMGSSGAGRIYVGEPKVYDNTFLQAQLNTTKARLLNLQSIDQASLLAKLGGVQGANSRQLVFTIQGLGQSTPQVATTTPAPSGAPAGTVNQTVATQGALTPTTPSVPSSSLSIPSTFSVSSLDLLNEQMQLTYEITNLELLLDGALSDRFLKTGGRKKAITVGVPISIEAVSEELANSVAEVEVTACNNPGVRAAEAPSVVTLLPREKTYNVASLVDRSASIGAGGIIAGVFSVGAGLLFGHRTYYLVQEQDTLAMLRNARTGICEGSPASTFAWQFRPVLDQKLVRAGTRQVFVQLSLPASAPMKCEGYLFVRTAWRRLDRKTAAVSPAAEWAELPKFSIPRFDTTPVADALEWQDVGGGLLRVKVSGNFLQGMAVRVGATALDTTTPGFTADTESIQFLASASAIATGGAYLIGRDGIPSEIRSPASGPFSLPLGECKTPDPSQGTPVGTTPPTQPPGPAPSEKQVAIAHVSEPSPASDTSSALQITLSKAPMDAAGSNPLVVTIGDKLYGLSGSPFTSQVVDKSGRVVEIRVVVPNDTLRSNPSVRVQRLFWGPYYVDRHEIPLLPDFAITKVSVVSPGDGASGVPAVLAVAGTGLTELALVAPPDSNAKVDVRNSALALVTIPAATLKAYKQLVFQNAGRISVVVALPDEGKTPAKPELKKAQVLQPGAPQLKIQGTALDQVAEIRYLRKSVKFALSLDRNTLTVDLPPEFTVSVGIRDLTIVYADGTTSRFEVTVNAAVPSM